MHVEKSLQALKQISKNNLLIRLVKICFLIKLAQISRNLLSNHNSRNLLSDHISRNIDSTFAIRVIKIGERMVKTITPSFPKII